MNRSDSERIASVLEKIGYQKASKESEANLIVVNMCSVRQSAVDRVYGKIRDFAKLKIKNEKLKIILTGCVLNSDKKKLKNKVDLILDIKNLPNWPKILNRKKNSLIQPWQINEYRCFYLGVKPKYSNNFLAFVPIMTGCNNFCSYCVVPFTRGPEVSRPAKEILSEVKDLVKMGFKEIWLLGQNVNSYRSESTLISTRNNAEVNFAKLLKMVNEIPGLQPAHHPPASRAPFWIRFTSPHPKNFSEELIETMAKCQKVTPYLNLPVQSGDNEILKRMNRPYTIEQYKDLIEKIRSKFVLIREGLEREIAISTDIIVGFPGETEKQFQNTAKLLKEIKFDMAYIARYSPRPGTAAAKLKDDVPAKEKERRWKILTEILKKTALEKNKKFVGKEVEVLPEEFKNGFLIGKTRHYKTVKFEGNKNLIGSFVKVKMTDALPWGLKGILL
jgi:tRNA-2-methylthio-N6-dimethylallyladenosine synthase